MTARPKKKSRRAPAGRVNAKKQSAPRKPSAKRKPNPVTKAHVKKKAAGAAASAARSVARRAFELVHWGNAPRGEVSLRVPDPTARSANLVTLGRIVEIVYETAKGGKLKVEYEHDAEARPRLLFDANDAHAFFIERTSMRMTEHGIVG